MTEEEFAATQRRASTRTAGGAGAVFDIIGKRKWFYLISAAVTIRACIFILLTFIPGSQARPPVLDRLHRRHDLGGPLPGRHARPGRCARGARRAGPRRVRGQPTTGRRSASYMLIRTEPLLRETEGRDARADGRRVARPGRQSVGAGRLAARSPAVSPSVAAPVARPLQPPLPVASPVATSAASSAPRPARPPPPRRVPPRGQPRPGRRRRRRPHGGPVRRAGRRAPGALRSHRRGAPADVRRRRS